MARRRAAPDAHAPRLPLVVVPATAGPLLDRSTSPAVLDAAEASLVAAATRSVRRTRRRRSASRWTVLGDGLLVGVGAGLGFLGVAMEVPELLVAGVAAAVLGAAHPARAAWDRARRRGRARTVRRALAGGLPLRTDHRSTEQLIARYSSVWAAAERLPAEAAGRVRGAAHALVVEAAQGLGGRPPATSNDVDDVILRVNALTDLELAVGTGLRGRGARVVCDRPGDDAAGGSPVCAAAGLAAALSAGVAGSEPVSTRP